MHSATDGQTDDSTIAIADRKLNDDGGGSVVTTTTTTMWQQTKLSEKISGQSRPLSLIDAETFAKR